MPKILAIDDDGLFLEMLFDVLEINGFQAITAQTGRLGLALAQEQNPDLIICDIRMPGLNGYDVLMALRQDPATATIPFIFLTAEQSESDRRRAKELGADDYLPKFCTFGGLIQSIKAQLTTLTPLSCQIK